MIVGIEYGDGGAPIAAPPAPQAQPAPDQVLLPESVGMPEDLAIQKAAEEAFAPPRGLWEYDLGSVDGMSDTDILEQGKVREALFAEGVPVHIVNLARQIGEYNVKGGPLTDAQFESSRTKGLQTLESRHGAEAKTIIARAKAVFDRVDARNPAIGDWLVQTGAANSPDFIEALARLR